MLLSTASHTLPNEPPAERARVLHAGSGEGAGVWKGSDSDGYAQASDRGHALAAGFQAHLAKPFEPGQLLRVLARSVQSSHDSGNDTAGASVALGPMCDPPEARCDRSG